MATRRNKNGQFSKSKRRRTTTTRRMTPSRRRSKPAVSAMKVAEQLVVANAVTKGLFGTDLRTFVMPTASNFQSWNNSWELTAKELVNLALGGGGGMDPANYNLPKSIKQNMQNNGTQSLTTIVAAPIAFRMARKVLAKPLINPANRLLRSVGIKEVKV